MMFLAVFFGCAVGWSLMGVVRSVFEHLREHRKGRAAVKSASWASSWNCTRCVYSCTNEQWRRDMTYTPPTESLYAQDQPLNHPGLLRTYEDWFRKYGGNK